MKSKAAPEEQKFAPCEILGGAVTCLLCAAVCHNPATLADHMSPKGHKRKLDASGSSEDTDTVNRFAKAPRNSDQKKLRTQEAASPSAPCKKCTEWTEYGQYYKRAYKDSQKEVQRLTALYNDSQKHVQRLTRLYKDCPKEADHLHAQVRELTESYAHAAADAVAATHAYHTLVILRKGSFPCARISCHIPSAFFIYI